MSQTQLVCTQSQSSSQFITDDDLLSNPLIMPLADILQLQEISYCVTVAEVEKVNSTKFGWYYFACFKCGKIAKGDNPPYTCESGHNTETEIVRYKLDLNVSYENTKGTFVMWDREATQLLGISAAQLRTNMIQAGITNRLEYPMLLDGIGEKTYVFKVKWQPKWKTTSVVCYRDADALVNLVKAKFPNAKVIPLLNESVGVDKPNDNTSLTEEVTMSAQELSGTAENDPDTLSQLTPISDKLQLKLNKDPSFDIPTPMTLVQPVMLPNPPLFEEIIPAKQSSSKRVKVIKTEKK
ncbi:putative nucleic acid-binding protein [Medicago truncatula]|nr:uncharacterized protein LOC25494471 [Medicago truncatula]RHN53216.1 putative nucleic acid-binding protein [Medicago truncatula]